MKITTFNIPAQDIVAIREAVANGAGIGALELGFDYPRHVLMRFVLAPSPNVGGPRITPEMRERIRAQHAAGVPVARIARELKVHRNSVHRVLSGQTWKA